MAKVDITVNGVVVELTDIIFDAIKQEATRDGIAIEHEIALMLKSGLMAKAIDEAKIRYQRGREGRRIQ